MSDAEEVYQLALQLEQELQYHLDYCPKLSKAHQLSQKLCNDLGWQWVKQKEF